MRPSRLQNALASLSDAIGEVNVAIEEAEGTRPACLPHFHQERQTAPGFGPAHWEQACELGFRGDLAEGQRLLGAAPDRR